MSTHIDHLECLASQAVAASCPKRKRPTADERGAAILEAASEIFAEEGFDTSTRRLANQWASLPP